MRHSDESPLKTSQVAYCKRAPFPLIEGVGIILGVMAWDLLNDGYVDIDKAFLIAAPCTAIWFAVRLWRNRTQKRSNTKNRTHGALDSDRTTHDSDTTATYR